ncbi:hypothetical protein C0J52_21618 [Blattella germanica]|nr:hypothetical protein C0J52_21618 [Blattella germanica]
MCTPASFSFNQTVSGHSFLDILELVSCQSWGLIVLISFNNKTALHLISLTNSGHSWKTVCQTDLLIMRIEK